MNRSLLACCLFSTTLLLAPTASAAKRELLKTDRFPAAAGHQVAVDAADVDVSVRAADVSEVAVTTDLRISGAGQERADAWIAGRTPSFEEEAGRLAVVLSPEKSGFLGFGLLTARARLQLVMPASVVPDLTTTKGNIDLRGDFPDAAPLFLRTSTGSVEMTGATSAIDFRSASGDARFELVRPLDKLFARTSSGDVTLTGGAKSVHVDTASGDVWLTGLSGSAEVVTSNGKITLRWDRLDPGATVTVRTSSGRIHLQLPPGVHPQGEIRTTVGEIRCDLPALPAEGGDTVTLDGDGPRLMVESASGEIVVGPRAD